MKKLVQHEQWGLVKQVATQFKDAEGVNNSV